MRWARGVEQEPDTPDDLEVATVGADMKAAENILDGSTWLFHSDWTDQRKAAVQKIETETGQTAALTGRNPKGDIRPMVRDQVRGWTS